MLERMMVIWGVLGLAACGSSLVGLQSDGTYVLERGEQSSGCDALHKNFKDRLEVLKALPEKAKAEREAAPATALSMFGRLFSGPNKGLAAIQEYDRERAHAHALQRTMHERKCLAVDLDRELAEADAEVTKIRRN
jgi:hypothetical protein